MRTIALATAREARSLDPDLPPLADALRALGAEVDLLDWDDAAVDWSRYQQVVLRSTWDYVERLPDFLAWCDSVAAVTQLCNAPSVVRWNTDKHYLGELSAHGIATVPSSFVEPGASAAQQLAEFRAGRAGEYVVKPCVGAGSRDAARYGANDDATAITHIDRLLRVGRSVLLQPYLSRVDEYGETALLFFNGEFSHAIRKGPLLRPASAPTDQLFAPEEISARVPSPAEHALAARVLECMRELPALRSQWPLAYARVDLLSDEHGQPCLLELELTEPSLFFDHAPGSAERFARVLLDR